MGLLGSLMGAGAVGAVESCTGWPGGVPGLPRRGGDGCVWRFAGNTGHLRFPPLGPDLAGLVVACDKELVVEGIEATARI